MQLELTAENKPALATENQPALSAESKAALATESNQHWPMKAKQKAANIGRWKQAGIGRWKQPAFAAESLHTCYNSTRLPLVHEVLDENKITPLLLSLNLLEEHSIVSKKLTWSCDLHT